MPPDGRSGAVVVVAAGCFFFQEMNDGMSWRNLYEYKQSTNTVGHNTEQQGTLIYNLKNENTDRV